MAFLDTWNALQTSLLRRTVIPNWTAHSGYIGKRFTVTDISDTFIRVDIRVDAPGAKVQQRVPRGDFEKIYDRWDDYVHGGLARSKFSPLTRYSKYIISVFHWLEAQTEGRLP